MVEMGRQPTAQDRSFGEVKMAPKAAPRVDDAESQKRADALNRMSGRKPESQIKNVKDHNKMGKDEFLKLLSFQLQNQDPFKPMDQAKFTGELAQFSQLEQLTNLNNKFDGLNQGKDVQGKFYAASMVGKVVVTDGNSLDYKGAGSNTDILFNLDQKAEKVAIRVLDKSGNIVQEIWQDGVGRGSHAVKWDGSSSDGTPALEGVYSIKVMAWNENAQLLPVQTRVTGQVQSVSFDGEEAILDVGGRKVSLRDVKSFHHDMSSINGDNNKKVVPTVNKEALNAYENTQKTL